jgi:hypothetical protein
MYLDGRKKKLPRAINYNELFKQEIKIKQTTSNQEELFNLIDK